MGETPDGLPYPGTIDQVYLAAILDQLRALTDILSPQRPQETEDNVVALVEPKPPGPSPKPKRGRPKKNTS